MENSQNLNEEKTPKKSKTNYQSIEEQITKIKLGFEHAKEASILAELSKVGYTQEKIEGFISKIAQVEQLSQVQKKEYGAQYAETGFWFKAVNKRLDTI